MALAFYLSSWCSCSSGSSCKASFLSGINHRFVLFFFNDTNSFLLWIKGEKKRKKLSFKFLNLSKYFVRVKTVRKRKKKNIRYQLFFPLKLYDTPEIFWVQEVWVFFPPLLIVFLLKKTLSRKSSPLFMDSCWTLEISSLCFSICRSWFTISFIPFPSSGFYSKPVVFFSCHLWWLLDFLLNHLLCIDLGYRSVRSFKNLNVAINPGEVSSTMSFSGVSQLY